MNSEKHDISLIRQSSNLKNSGNMVTFYSVVHSNEISIDNHIAVSATVSVYQMLCSC